MPNQPVIRNHLRLVQRLIQLDRQLPEILSGKARPQGPGVALERAQFCADYKGQYRAAARFYAAAFAETKLADDLPAGHRYNAACAAALAAAGKGADAAKLDNRERTRLRGQALDWLRADLTTSIDLVEKDKGESRQMIQERLAHWDQDPDLTAVRDDKALAALPEKEREDWRKLWADVAALRKKIE